MLYIPATISTKFQSQAKIQSIFRLCSGSSQSAEQHQSEVSLPSAEQFRLSVSSPSAEQERSSLDDIPEFQRCPNRGFQRFNPLLKPYRGFQRFNPMLKPFGSPEAGKCPPRLEEDSPTSINTGVGLEGHHFRDRSQSSETSSRGNLRHHKRSKRGSDRHKSGPDDGRRSHHKDSRNGSGRRWVTQGSPNWVIQQSGSPGRDL